MKSDVTDTYVQKYVSLFHFSKLVRRQIANLITHRKIIQSVLTDCQLSSLLGVAPVSWALSLVYRAINCNFIHSNMNDCHWLFRIGISAIFRSFIVFFFFSFLNILFFRFSPHHRHRQQMDAYLKCSLFIQSLSFHRLTVLHNCTHPVHIRILSVS